uniref:Uncharacterized protein n=1 Tax=Arundo donax TaxID=35708 RepID=A0A0A9F1P2_ARUDO
MDPNITEHSFCISFELSGILLCYPSYPDLQQSSYLISFGSCLRSPPIAWHLPFSAIHCAGSKSGSFILFCHALPKLFSSFSLLQKHLAQTLHNAGHIAILNRLMCRILARKNRPGYCTAGKHNQQSTTKTSYQRRIEDLCPGSMM